MHPIASELYTKLYYMAEYKTIEDDIDIIVLLARLKQVFVKKLALLIILTVSGAILGGGVYFILKPKYTTQMLVKSKVITYYEAASLINNLDNLVEDENYITLSQKLKLPEQEVETLTSIEAINPLEAEIIRMNSQDIKEEIFVVEIQINSTQFLEKLQRGIISYLENNPYVQARVAEDKENLTLSIRKIQTELTQIDSLKKNIQNLFGQNYTQTLLIPDLGDLYQKYIGLYEKQLDYKTELKFIESFDVLEGFTKMNKPSSVGLGQLVGLGVVFGLLVWVLYVIFLEINRAIQKIPQEKI